MGFRGVGETWTYARIRSGGSGIRTHGRVTPTPVFKTGSLNHSDTPPELRTFYVGERGESSDGGGAGLSRVAVRPAAGGPGGWAHRAAVRHYHRRAAGGAAGAIAVQRRAAGIAGGPGGPGGAGQPLRTCGRHLQELAAGGQTEAGPGAGALPVRP